MKYARTAASPATTAFSGRRIRICPGIFNSCYTSGKYLNSLPAISRYRIEILVISPKNQTAPVPAMEKIMSSIMGKRLALLLHGMGKKLKNGRGGI